MKTITFPSKPSCADRPVKSRLRCERARGTREIISEIQRLPPNEQAEVIQFAYRLDAERMLSGKELGALAQRIIDTIDPVEKLRIRQELARSFYGGGVLPCLIR